MKKLFFPFLIALGLFSVSCQKDEVVIESYNPSEPIEITSFTPDSGRVAEKVIICGKNFGSVKDSVAVYFTDSIGKENKAVIVGVDNTTIYCLAPRQAQGINQISVKAYGKTVSATKGFKYTVSENVSTIAGDFVETKTGTNGTLAEATFGQMFGVACVDDQSCFVGQAWNSNGVRYVSVEEDRVITVHDGAVIGKMAINKNKDCAYGMMINGINTLYRYRKSNAWVPERITDADTKDDVWSVALDKSEKYVYYVSVTGELGRIDLTSMVRKPLLKDEAFAGNARYSSEPFNYICYSHFEDCFYVTTSHNRIIRLTVTEGEEGADPVVDYTVINVASQTGNADGYLEDAKFRYLNGLCIDDDGNIYICQGDHTIRKISYDVDITKRYVTTILGKKDTKGTEDGLPSVALFNYPQDISYDGNGGFWIAMRYEPALRKYTEE